MSAQDGRVPPRTASRSAGLHPGAMELLGGLLELCAFVVELADGVLSAIGLSHRRDGKARQEGGPGRPADEPGEPRK
ncbi:MAG: hypothetical protein K2X71_27870 [Methylobacterium sp.]|uniref:hypothetical protein n=1 Tax=Methylobacterium sp. TaxID=409 RepID=UPI002584509A|nr:hypothetical protein [Methylobacterium sp.]MBY0299811.1 hypothetical protein [Methylobacterium sp.]